MRSLVLSGAGIMLALLGACDGGAALADGATPLGGDIADAVPTSLISNGEFGNGLADWVFEAFRANAEAAPAQRCGLSGHSCANITVSSLARSADANLPILRQALRSPILAGHPHTVQWIVRGPVDAKIRVVIEGEASNRVVRPLAKEFVLTNAVQRLHEDFLPATTSTHASLRFVFATPGDYWLDAVSVFPYLPHPVIEDVSSTRSITTASSSGAR